MAGFRVLQDGAEVPPSGVAAPLPNTFAISGLVAPAPRTRFPLGIQWQDEGVNAGEPNVRVVNIITDPLVYTASRGTGEKSNVITIGPPPPSPVSFPPVAAPPPPPSGYVCVGGPTWYSITAPAAATYQALAWDPGADVLVAAGKANGSNGVAMVRSTDFGLTWTSVASPPVFAGPNPVYPKCMAFGNGVFVCVGSTLDVATSSDGITWAVTGRIQTDHTRLYFGGGLFVLVAANDQHVITSPDGVNWTQRALPAVDTAWTGAAFANGLHMLISNTACITSPDTVTWTAGGSLTHSAGGSFSDPAYGAGVWVMPLGALAQFLMYSSDNGATWHQSNAYSDVTLTAPWVDVRFYGGLFYAIDGTGAKCVKSADGITWTTASPMPVAASKIWSYISDGAGRYAACGATGGPDTLLAYGVCAIPGPPTDPMFADVLLLMAGDSTSDDLSPHNRLIIGGGGAGGVGSNPVTVSTDHLVFGQPMLKVPPASGGSSSFAVQYGYGGGFIDPLFLGALDFSIEFFMWVDSVPGGDSFQPTAVTQGSSTPLLWGTGLATLSENWSVWGGFNSDSSPGAWGIQMNTAVAFARGSLQFVQLIRSGSTFTLAVNGAVIGTATYAGNLDETTRTGSYVFCTNQGFVTQHYIAQYRVTRGVRPIEIPTAPWPIV